MPSKKYSQPKGRSLLVEILDEDIAWACKQDRYGCAIVRAIQRALPEALRVKADTKEIAFSLPDDDTRYYFQTPQEVVTNVIEPFDKDKPIKERTFILEKAYAAEPINHATAKQRQEIRSRHRRAPRARSTSGAVRTTNRFLDYEAQEADAS